MNNKRKHRIIITGDVQTGKSTLALGLALRLKGRSIKISGFIARGLWKNNRRYGFNLFDLKTEVLTPLARREEDSKSFYHRIPFKFFENGMQAGISSLLPENCIDAEIIIIDEIGPMELQDLGWAPYISPLLSSPGAVHIWIVRERLVEAVCTKWPFIRTDIINVNEENALEKLLSVTAGMDASTPLRSPESSGRNGNFQG